jgi:hypothetical protein
MFDINGLTFDIHCHSVVNPATFVPAEFPCGTEEIARGFPEIPAQRSVVEKTKTKEILS